MSNRLSDTSVQNSPFVRGSLSHTPFKTEDFQQNIAEEVADTCRNDLAVDEPNYFGDVDRHDHTITEPDYCQPLTVEFPLTLSKICLKLTAVERLWLARMVKAHGKELVLARWPAYEVQINFVRYLRQISTHIPDGERP